MGYIIIKIFEHLKNIYFQFLGCAQFLTVRSTVSFKNCQFLALI